jgi:hypothetical protein
MRVTSTTLPVSTLIHDNLIFVTGATSQLPLNPIRERQLKRLGFFEKATRNVSIRCFVASSVMFSPCKEKP